MPHFEFHAGGRPIFRHLLRPGRTVIGRSDRCDVAIPSEAVSRVHCIVEQRPEGWQVVDRSRNGTLLNGEVVRRAPLRDGDELQLGDFRARFVDDPRGARDATTATIAALPATHEELVEGTEGGVAATVAELVFTAGPLEGRTFVLDRPVTRLGGERAHIRLGPGLPDAVVTLRVARGRVMVEPNAGSPMLAGHRVREITPALPGESLRVLDHVAEIRLRTGISDCGERSSFGELVGSSPEMRRTFGVLARMAAHDLPVLITGESGTGKELAARALHHAGARQEGPFVAINCAAIADNLFESELFGHEKGAFTGASARQDGAFQRAAGGTLFLDEIGELKLDFQAKLLRALESGEVRRVGGAAPEFPDVRIVAATHRDLGGMIREGAFREDLFFRLSVLTVKMPSLRERRDDVETIARTLLDRQHPGAILTDDAAQALRDYDWPGNVRELRNVLTRAWVMSGPQISAAELTFHPWSFQESRPAASAPATHATMPVRALAEEAERLQILNALQTAGGNRTKAAQRLGIPRSSLLYKLQKYRIDT
jgi:DNA-binding NtrC family response regulator